MLEPIFGNGTAEKVLLDILVHREAYARELAQTFEVPISVIQKQLVRLERGGVLAGVDAVLVGGSVVSIYSDERYVTDDLDFVSYKPLKVIAPVTGVFSPLISRTWKLG